MRKVVINAVHGGFGLSPKALLWMWEKGCKEIATPVREYFGEVEGEPLDEYHQKYGMAASLEKWREFQKSGEQESFFLKVFSPCEQYVLSASGYDGIKRDNPLLVQVVEEMGAEANGFCAELKIVEIPFYVKWHIAEYDGVEWVAEDHQTWS